MPRVRISTTVDRDTLETARRLAPGLDSRLVQQALVALIDARLGERERAALASHPYEVDPDLAWHPGLGPDLPYDGPVPEDVLRLTRTRPRTRT